MTSIADFRAYALVKCFEKGVNDYARRIYSAYCTQNWNNYSQLRFQLSNRLNHYTRILETSKNPRPDLFELYSICFNTYLDLWNYLNKEEKNDNNR